MSQTSHPTCRARRPCARAPLAARALAAAAIATAASASAATPAGPGAAELERELAAARQRLEAAAREVAALSGRLAGDDVLRYSGEGRRRALLGVQLGAPGDDGGVPVAGVSPGGPAADAGVQAGDVIVAIDGTRVRDAGTITARLREVEPGATTRLELRRDGRPRTITVTTRAAEPRVLVLRRGPGGGEGFDLDFDGPFAPPAPGMPLALPFARGGLGDLELATVSPGLARYFGTERGVLVVRAPEGAALPLRDGDVITAIDGREPRSGSHALRILRSYQPGEKLTLAIVRDRRAQTLVATLPETNPPAGPPAAAPPRAPAAPAPGG